ncbi:MAG TPA: ATP-binding protein [Ramlibacter sp.]|nr:ATP-binding protein [Ramlibacter sp.]
MTTPSTYVKPTVLIIDDAPEYLSMLAAMLESTYAVRLASSGGRGLRLALQEPRPDVVILDVLMPDMDGHAVLAALRADPRTSDIPVVFMTSLAQIGDEVAGLAEGAADYIVKPAPPKVVRARVRVQIELKQMRDRLSERNAALQREIEHRNQVEQALQRTIAELEAFSYSVSHDLRSPLSAINAFAVSLLESESAALTQQGQHRLERIVAGSRRMDKMIDDILLCSRAERSEMHLQMVQLDVMVAEIVAEMHYAWPATRIGIGHLPEVYADATMLRQVLGNLIGNALKFSGGRVDAQVEIEAHTVGGVTEVWVRDNGVGFDMAYGYKLFTLFQRLHSDTEFPGSGVGLAIVKRLVSRHGGSVRADSVPGGWTTFCFTLGAPDRAMMEERARAARQLSAQWH